MGEYAQSPSGTRIKLGTCECLFYVTRADVVALHRAGWRGDGCSLQSYLNNQAFRFALPSTFDIPGDIATIENRKPDYAHRYRIRVNAATVDALRSEVDHGAMCHNANGVNFILPCPCGKDWDGSIKTSGLHLSFDLIAEGADGRAVYGCPFCGHSFNLVGHSLQPAMRRMFDDQWTVGQSRLDDRTAAYLRRLIDYKPVTVTA